jgi:hypothetical protein
VPVKRKKNYWSEEESKKLEEALTIYQKKGTPSNQSDLKEIAQFIGTRTVPQVRSKLQKYFLKQEKELKRQYYTKMNPTDSEMKESGMKMSEYEDEEGDSEDSDSEQGSSEKKPENFEEMLLGKRLNNEHLPVEKKEEKHIRDFEANGHVFAAQEY